MELQELKEIIRLLKEEGLTEITVVDGDQRVTVKRILHQNQPEAALSPPSETSVRAEAARPAEADFSLTAPLVGTFYGRPSPEEKPFVAAGDVVQPGDTVCVIEAMKVMNEIKAEMPGRVRQILLEDGAAVEFGQAMILFERL